VTFEKYLDKQTAYGKCYFTIDNASQELNKSKNALKLSISHLISKGEIASPSRGFYVIIPPEYRILGCIPADQFIPYLMEYLTCKYYVGLMTAASYYGVAHQAPQVFQVMTERQLSPIMCGKVKIQFIKNQLIDTVPTNLISTPKSRFLVATPEALAMDFFRFMKQSGGLNNITTMLCELTDKIDEEKLRLIIETQPGINWKQRLGYVLDFIESRSLASIIKKYLSEQPRVNYIPLNSSVKKSNKKEKDQTWKIIVNTTIESDI